MPKSSLRVCLISIALLIPCFWQSRIQAGDLSSHLYNAWLGVEIQAGRAPGLELTTPATNVLFDRILLWLTAAGGSSFAEHVAVPAAVLVLFWGGVVWIRVATGAVPWFLMPCLAMLAYGWTFHNGFFNFYLGTGLTFWALALGWKPGRMRLAGAGALLALAYSAQAIGPLWGAGVLVYVYAARWVSEERRVWLMAGAIVMTGVLRIVLDWRYETLSTSHQVLEMVGIDQVWVFGPKYIAVSLALGLVWGFLLLRLENVAGWKALLASIPFQLCAVMSLAILILPTRVELPAYKAALAFITERVTLPFGFLICLLLSTARPPAWQKWGMASVAVVFFSFLAVDTRALNQWEDEAGRAIAELPRGARVVSSFRDWGSRVILGYFPAERACIGQCYSYQNYEPSSRAFQVVARGPNSFVMDAPVDIAAVGTGTYVVRERDLPLFQIAECGAGRLCVKQLAAGDKVEAKELNLLPLLW